MASRTSFNATGVPRLNPYIPHAVVAGNLVFVSGTAGVDPITGKLIEGGFEEQAKQAFRNIQTILQEVGSDLAKVVKTTVFMVSGADADFVMINRAYSHFFPTEPPARSAPQVMPFPGGILVSVECIAILSMTVLRPIDAYFLQKDEPIKSCLQFLRAYILKQDPNLSEAWKYGMPFFCYKGKMCCYLWVHKTLHQPYIGFVEGKHMHHPDLLQEKRARMKIFLIDPAQDIALDTLNELFGVMLKIYR